MNDAVLYAVDADGIAAADQKFAVARLEVRMRRVMRESVERHSVTPKTVLKRATSWQNCLKSHKPSGPR